MSNGLQTMTEDAPGLPNSVLLALHNRSRVPMEDDIDDNVMQYESNEDIQMMKAASSLMETNASKRQERGGNTTIEKYVCRFDVFYGKRFRRKKQRGTVWVRRNNYAGLSSMVFMKRYRSLFYWIATLRWQMYRRRRGKYVLPRRTKERRANRNICESFK